MNPQKWYNPCVSTCLVLQRLSTSEKYPGWIGLHDRYMSEHTHDFIPTTTTTTTTTSCCNCNCYRYSTAQHSTYFATEDHLCKNQQTVKPEATAIQQFAYSTAQPNSLLYTSLARARLTWMMFAALSQPIANSTMLNLAVLFRIFTN